MEHADIFTLLTSACTDASGRFNVRLLKTQQYDHLRLRLIEATKCLPKDTKLSVRYHFLKQGGTTDPFVCEVCGAPTKYNKQHQRFNRCCSRTCTQRSASTRSKVENTNKMRYGGIAPVSSSSIRDKIRETNQHRYGADTPFESEEVQTKVANTITNRYGTTSTALVPSIREQQIQTRRLNYGVDFPFQSSQIQQDITDSNQSKYHRNRFSQTTISDNTLEKLQDPEWMHHQHMTLKKPLTQIASELGDVSDTTIGRWLHTHGFRTHHFIESVGEKQLAEFIESLDVTIERNNRTLISPKELDIYIPSHKLAIEYCGVYWHSEGMGKDRNYHKQKYEACAQQGIRLLTIFDTEWETNRNIVEAKLISIMGLATERVYARNCSIIEISHSQKKEFLNKHHIQGTGPGGITYGLEYKGDVVAVMTFVSTQKEVVLNRYATSVNVVGGFSKLLKHFQRNHKWSRMVSFADRRWSNGGVYTRTGWTLEHIIPPEYKYIIGNQPQHKFAFRRKALEKKLANFDPLLSEWENMKAHGYDRIWDCGKLRFVLTNLTQKGSHVDESMRV